MSMFLIATLLLIIVAVNVFCGSMNKKEGFASGGNQKELVFIHMNGCGHCEKMKPDWKAANKENKSSIKMRDVEMSQGDGPELCKKHKINGFPTIILLENGQKVSDYNGERSKNGILEFLNSN